MTIMIFYMSINKLFNLKKVLSKIIVYLSSVLFVEIIYFFLTNSFLSDNRSDVNQVRLQTNIVNSVINNPLANTSLITDFINFVHGFLELIIPIDGLGSINEAAYYVWIWTIIISLNSKKKIIFRKSYRNGLYFTFFYFFYLNSIFL